MADDWNEAHDIIYGACGYVASGMAEQASALTFHVEEDPRLVYIYEAGSGEALTFRLKGDKSAVEVLRGTTVAGDPSKMAPQNPDEPTNTWPFHQVSREVIIESVKHWQNAKNLMM